MQSKQRVETYGEFRTVRLRTLAYKRGADPVGPADPPMLGLKRLARACSAGVGSITIRVRAGAKEWRPEGCSCGAWGRKTARSLSAFFRGAFEQCPRDNYH